MTQLDIKTPLTTGSSLLNLEDYQFHLLLGSAGTGKSTLLRKLSQQYEMYVTSSTGISAINVGGCTINSALRFFKADDLREKALFADGSVKGEFANLMRGIANKYQVLVIDEVSMLTGQIAVILTDVILKLGLDLKLLLVGDFCQLPVVVPKRVEKGKMVPYPFFRATQALGLYNITYLTKVWRQSDPAFIQALNCIRVGDGRGALPFFQEQVGFHSKRDDSYVGTTIIPTNKQVDEYNTTNLQRLPGPSRVYYKRVTGITSSDWESIPDQVELREGAKVVMLANNLSRQIDQDTGYANGDLATVLETYSDTVRVRIERTGRDHLIEYIDRENKGPLDVKAKGHCYFLPMRVAYAMTVHKTQGMTLDHVQAQLGGSFLPTLSGGLYTMISRIRDYRNLRLVGTPESFVRSCYLDPAVRQFMDSLETEVAA